MAGKVDTAGLALLAGQHTSHRRRDESRAEARVRELERETAVLRECLQLAMAELAFCSMPNTRQCLRLIRERTAAGGVEA